jgi:hypothetical protein
MKMDGKGKSFQEKLSTGQRVASKDLRKFIVFGLVLLTIFSVVNPAFASTTNNTYIGSKVNADINQEAATPTSTPMVADSPTTTPAVPTATVTDVPATQTPEQATPTLTNTPELPTISPTIPVEMPTNTNTVEPPTAIPTPTLIVPSPTITVSPTATTDDLNSQGSTTYYVSALGSDSNSGTLSQPWKTIQKGVSGLVAGDTLYVRGGTYAETITINVSGSSTAPIVISSYPGENAIINSSGMNLASNSVMANIHGSYITFENFEVINPFGIGVHIASNGNSNIVRNLNIHNIYMAALTIWGRYNLVEQNRIWDAARVHYYHPDQNWPGALEIGDTDNAYYGLDTTIRNNEIYQSFGEGILCQYTDNSLIEGNRVWDTWGPPIYQDSCSYITIRNNFVYFTSDTRFWSLISPTRPGIGIFLSDENIIAGHPVGRDQKIYNNIIVNCGLGISFSNHNTDGAALINVIIANNTIVNEDASYIAHGIHVGEPGGSGSNHNYNSTIENNLVLIPYGSVGDVRGPTSGLTFTDNLWRGTIDSSVAGTGAINDDPLLVNPTQTIELDQITYPLDAAGYAPSSSSPAINKANPIPDVIYDYFGNNRGTSPDIGAIEFMGTPFPTRTPVIATPTSTYTP